MGKNYMPLGSRAKNDIKKTDKRMKEAILAEREQIRAYRRKLAAVRAPLLKSGPHHGPVVTINVHATSEGYAVHLEINDQGQMIVQQQPPATSTSPWGNTLAGIVAALEKLQPGCATTFILTDAHLAAMLCPEELEQRKLENWINPKTSLPRSHAEQWQRIHELLQGHRYLGQGNQDIQSPRLKECQQALKKALHR